MSRAAVERKKYGEKKKKTITNKTSTDIKIQDKLGGTRRSTYFNLKVVDFCEVKIPQKIKAISSDKI